MDPLKVIGRVSKSNWKTSPGRLSIIKGQLGDMIILRGSNYCLCLQEPCPVKKTKKAQGS